MKTSTIIKAVAGIWFVLFVYSVLSSDFAEKVIAEEITGVVVEKGTGKPIANAVVAIRFERHNTGHGSPYCFRSMATETDVNGRFRFEPWMQENTLANSFLGEIIAYKKGYAIPRHEAEYITHSRRSFLGIRFSKDLHIPKTERKVEVREWAGTDEDRVRQLAQVVSQFSCGEPSNKVNPALKELLYARIRQEVLDSPVANIAVDSGSSYTNRTWIESAQKFFDR